MVWGRWRGAIVLPIVVLACGDDDVTAPPPVLETEAGTGPTVTVRTNAPATSLSRPGPANATLAMALGADGTWSPLVAKETGVYAVPLRGDRWTVTFVCADQDSAYVDTYDRGKAVTEFSIELPPPCALAPDDVGDVTGRFSNAPPLTSWFDFGYLGDDRGSSLPLDGTSADYELLNIITGTWDFFFGFRDDPAGPLTKMFIVRDLACGPVTTNKLDADLEAAGFVPGSKALTIVGLAPDEQLRAPVLYTMTGGTHGIDVGPQVTTGPNLTYATVPVDKQRPADKYRLAFSARLPDGTGERGANAVFHDAVDLAIDLAPALAAPVVTKVSDAPYPRLSMKSTGRASASLHELRAITVITDTTGRYWTYSTDAAIADGAEVAFEMPDYSTVKGWNGGWSVLPDRTEVTATVHEKSASLSDGILDRFSSHTVRVTP